MLVFTSVCQKHGLASTEYVIFIFQKIRFVEARLSEVALFGNVRFAEAKRSKTKRNIILSSVWGGCRHFISRSSPFAVSLSLEFKENRHALFCWRPYRVECTGSLLTSEVKRHRARLVLGWGTAWEHPWVLPAFSHIALPRREAQALPPGSVAGISPRSLPRPTSFWRLCNARLAKSHTSPNLH